MNKATQTLKGIIAVLVFLLASGVDALVIYRIGGEEIEPPPEADQVGVEFINVGWEDVDPNVGGGMVDLDLGPRAVRALRRDPQVNITPTAEDKGGIYIHPSVNAQVWDGDTGTVWAAAPYNCANLAAYWHRCGEGFGTLGTANIVLDGLYQIDRIRVVSGLLDPGKTVQAVRVFVAREEQSGRPSHWRPSPYSPWLVEVRDNREQILDIPIPEHDEAGFVQVTVGEHTGDWEVHDIHIYAKGFVRRSTYASNIIDFGSEMAWGEMRWSGSRGERAKVVIRTRSGMTDTPLRYWKYTGRGGDTEAVTPSQYSKLRPGEKAGTTNDPDNWDFWSNYEFGDSLGTQVVSTSPRQFFQFQVDFLPQDEDGGEVSFLEFRASSPLATNLVGEVWPVEARVGEPTEFTYTLLPTILSGDEGFDRIEIHSLSLLGGVRAVRIDDGAVSYTVDVEEAHRLAVGIPRMDSLKSGATVEIDFTAQVLRYGAVFETRVRDSQQPLEVPQGVNPGDATVLFEGDRVAVATISGSEAQLLRLSAESTVVTPNADGANDEARLTYEILEITSLAAVRVEISDLSGRRVRLVHEGTEGIGSHLRSWDGRDQSGLLVPPGVYMATVSAITDRGDIKRTRVLHVAY